MRKALRGVDGDRLHLLVSCSGCESRGETVDFPLSTSLLVLTNPRRSSRGLSGSAIDRLDAGGFFTVVGQPRRSARMAATA
jgi:hypothetical protein